ncbi:hypothetical protein ASD15_04260 [Massilia sp. Root351]|jgi:hypothetical protein|uniref:hypothetical protein n=1 Tax=Massilia sp. Root351 TaxID=1736522 RepID=UPI00070D5F9B|nr:hypothetical protein [Massilia sp. Root351]KQV91262.1 hypothetical protein ASD15_04260 [Massilia sp. Root351]
MGRLGLAGLVQRGDCGLRRQRAGMVVDGAAAAGHADGRFQHDVLVKWSAAAVWHAAPDGKLIAR